MRELTAAQADDLYEQASLDQRSGAVLVKVIEEAGDGDDAGPR